MFKVSDARVRQPSTEANWSDAIMPDLRSQAKILSQSSLDVEMRTHIFTKMEI